VLVDDWHQHSFHGDLNETYTVGNVEKKYKDLIKCTYDATMKAIETGRPFGRCAYGFKG